MSATHVAFSATMAVALALAPGAYAGLQDEAGPIASESLTAQLKAKGPRIIEERPFVSQTGGQTNPKLYGKTIGEWSAAWWRWALSFPRSMNPVLDTTGEFCDMGQSGPVWFLAGAFGGTAERTCTIPAGKALFYPLANHFWIDCPPPSTDAGVTEQEIRWVLANFSASGDGACELRSTLDSFDGPNFGEQARPVSGLMRPASRSQSPVFRLHLPEDHILLGSSDCPTEIEPGISGRVISEGHWVMLPPLKSGEHVLTLHGAGCSADFGLDDQNKPIKVKVINRKTGKVLKDVEVLRRVFENEVTYHLTVLPHKRKRN